MAYLEVKVPMVEALPADCSSVAVDRGLGEAPDIWEASGLGRGGWIGGVRHRGARHGLRRKM